MDSGPRESYYFRDMPRIMGLFLSTAVSYETVEHRIADCLKVGAEHREHIEAEARENYGHGTQQY